MPRPCGRCRRRSDTSLKEQGSRSGLRCGSRGGRPPWTSTTELAGMIRFPSNFARGRPEHFNSHHPGRSRCDRTDRFIPAGDSVPRDHLLRICGASSPGVPCRPDPIRRTNAVCVPGAPQEPNRHPGVVAVIPVLPGVEQIVHHDVEVPVSIEVGESRTWEIPRVAKPHSGATSRKIGTTALRSLTGTAARRSPVRLQEKNVGRFSCGKVTILGGPRSKSPSSEGCGRDPFAPSPSRKSGAFHL